MTDNEVNRSEDVSMAEVDDYETSTEGASTIHDEPPLTPGLSVSHSMQVSDDSTESESSMPQRRSSKRRRLTRDLNGDTPSTFDRLNTGHEGSSSSSEARSVPSQLSDDGSLHHDVIAGQQSFFGQPREFISLILSQRGVESQTAEPEASDPTPHISSPSWLDLFTAPSPGIIRFLRRKSMTWPAYTPPHPTRSASFPL